MSAFGKGLSSVKCRRRVPSMVPSPYLAVCALMRSAADRDGDRAKRFNLHRVLHSGEGFPQNPAVARQDAVRAVEPPRRRPLIDGRAPPPQVVAVPVAATDSRMRLGAHSETELAARISSTLTAA
jgi:hypothetical protein